MPTLSVFGFPVYLIDGVVIIAGNFFIPLILSGVSAKFGWLCMISIIFILIIRCQK